MKKLILIFSLFNLFVFNLSSQVYSKQQLLESNHWIYDALNTLNLQDKKLSLSDSVPMTVAEIEMYINDINYENLEDSAKDLYNSVKNYLNTKSFSFGKEAFKFGFNLEVTPEFLFQSNKNLDWTFATDYCNEIKDGSASNFANDKYNVPFIKIPIFLGFSDFIAIQADPFFGKSYWGFVNNNNYTNIPLQAKDFEFLWPRNAYGNFGYNFGSWGLNLSIAKEGLQHGKTLLGSVIYNSSFETDCFVQLNLYSKRFRYNLDVVQSEYDKYMYMHSFTALPFNWLKFGILEGTFVNGPFELRFLNPLMIMHSFGSWFQYRDENESKYYNESDVCQYMGINVELMPIKNLRMYFYYSQNETQSALELQSTIGKLMPDSFGMQLGFDYSLFGKNNDYFSFGLEGLYTTPFMYLKHGKDFSLFRERENMQTSNIKKINSWIGTPLGPDAIGAEAFIKYEKNRKWSTKLNYKFIAHGTNSFNLFDNYVEIEGEKYYTYYPVAEYNILKEYKNELNKANIKLNNAITTQEKEIAQKEIDNVKNKYKEVSYLTDEEFNNLEKELINKARDYKLSGIIQLTNQISLESEYILNKHFSFNGKVSYIYIFNSKNIPGNFEHGVELELMAKYTLY